MSSVNGQLMVWMLQAGKILDCVISDMTMLVRKHASINSILFDNKNHYRNFKRSLNDFDWLLHRP